MNQYVPGTDAVIELGGEDAKIIFFGGTFTVVEPMSMPTRRSNILTSEIAKNMRVRCPSLWSRLNTGYSVDSDRSISRRSCWVKL